MLDETAAAQAGVISRAQALAAGLSRTAIRVRLRSGRWQRMMPGIYLTNSGPPQRASVQWAALLYAGTGAMLSHASAAELLGLGDPPQAPGSGSWQGGAGTPPVHVTVPAGRKVAPVPGVIVHRSRRAGSARHPNRVPPQTRVEETVLDLVDAAVDLDEAIGWLAKACGRRLSTPARLRAYAVARTRLRRRAQIVDALADVAAGCHSPLEVRYFRHVERRHRLPPGARQRWRRRPGGRWYDDVTYPGLNTVVELDGRAGHGDERHWRDLARDNAAAAEGLTVLRYGSADVTDRPCLVAAQVSTVLRRNGWAGAPVQCRSNCPAATVEERAR